MSRGNDVDGPRSHRRLRLELRDLRRSKGFTHRQVADAMEWSTSKVVRIENGDVRVALADLRQLLTLYEVNETEQVETLLVLARRSRHQPWRVFRDVHSPAFLRFVGYEATATSAWHFQPQFVPGILQTPSYTRALLAGTDLRPRTEEEIARILEARLRRQAVLQEPHPAALVVLLDESVILRWVGGPGVMREQLMHLLDLSERPTVRLQVIPLRSDVYALMRTPCVLLSFDDPEEPDVLYLECPGGEVTTRDGPEGLSSRGSYPLAAYRAAMDHLVTIARSEEASREQIRAIADGLA